MHTPDTEVPWTTRRFLVSRSELVHGVGEYGGPELHDVCAGHFWPDWGADWPASALELSESGCALACEVMAPGSLIGT